MKKIFVLLIFFFFASVTAAPASVLTPDLYLSPGNIEVSPGDTFSIDLSIDLIFHHQR
jgi:hypothetical protein